MHIRGCMTRKGLKGQRINYRDSDDTSAERLEVNIINDASNNVNGQEFIAMNSSREGNGGAVYFTLEDMRSDFSSPFPTPSA